MKNDLTAEQINTKRGGTEDSKTMRVNIPKTPRDVHVVSNITCNKNDRIK